MHLGILQTGPVMPEIAARFGQYTDMFARFLGGRGWRFSPYHVMDMNFPGDIRDCDAWLLTGSRYGAYEDHAFIPPLEDFVRRADAARSPMIGICFGHQIIAQALGGKVEKYARGWGLGRTVYDVEGPGTLALTAWHQDQVTRPPVSARVIARGDSCPNAGMVIGDHILTLQPHPEFDTDVTREFIRLREASPDYPPEVMAAAKRALDAPLDTGRTADFIAGFLDAALGQGQGANDQADHVAATPSPEKAAQDV